VLTDTLRGISPRSEFKPLHPDEWGQYPWYPLLALREIEENTLPILRGRKALLRKLKTTRQHREWIIGNYYWALWKWHMKEIHEDKFKFVLSLCVEVLRGVLLTPVPAHLIMGSGVVNEDEGTTGLATKPTLTDLGGDATLLPPPISHILAGSTKTHLSRRGESILRAIRTPPPVGSTQPLTTREKILRALTDDAYA